MPEMPGIGVIQRTGGRHLPYVHLVNHWSSQFYRGRDLVTLFPLSAVVASLPSFILYRAGDTLPLL